MLKKDNKKEILDNNYFLNKRKDGRKKNKFEKHRTIFFVLAFVFSIAIIITLYIISPYSKTFNVVVKGNTYLSKEDVIKEANLSDYFLLTFPSYKQNKLKENIFIKDCNIEMLEGNIVAIEITEEKAIGYIQDNGEPKLLLANDERIPLSEDNMYLISTVPLIEGYTDEELLKVEKGFEKIDTSIIALLSEIHKYPVSFDETYNMIIMEDGNYCFGSYNDLWLLANYYDVLSFTDTSLGHACFYLDELSESVSIGSCPWQMEGQNND